VAACAETSKFSAAAAAAVDEAGDIEPALSGAGKSTPARACVRTGDATGGDEDLPAAGGESGGTVRAAAIVAELTFSLLPSAPSGGP
jgi:hypothetical protein